MNSIAERTKPHAARPKQTLLGRFKRLLIGLLIALVTLIASGAVYQAVATALDRRTYPPPGQLVDVGGYRVHLFSTGTNNGNPTVILLGCGGCTSSNWGWVQPQVAQFTRVVAYDRAGFGWSDPGPQPRDALQNVRELHAALAKAGIPGPYVLVGHSYSGPIARVFASQYPDEVLGMVLVDPRHPDQDTRLPPEERAKGAAEIDMIDTVHFLARFGILRFTDQGKELDLPARQSAEYNAFRVSTQFWDSVVEQNAAIQATDAQTRAAGSLGGRPLVVLSAESAWWTPGGPADEMRRVYTQLNIEQAALSSNSVHRVVAGASHMSLVNKREHAQAVIDAIGQVVEVARSGQPLALTRVQLARPPARPPHTRRGSPARISPPSMDAPAQPAAPAPTPVGSTGHARAGSAAARQSW